MKNEAKNGNNLIFTGSTYDLTNTIVVSKSINIKSENKTQINFKKDKSMFKVTVSGVNFDGLFLNYNVKREYGGGYDDALIYAPGSSKKINIKDTDIKATGDYVHTVHIERWCGNVTNCKINIEGQSCGALTSNTWTGNIINSKITTGTGLGTQHTDAIIYSGIWKGSIINSEISSKSYCSISTSWYGKITGSKIYSNAEKKETGATYGLFLFDSKGTIINSTIKSLNSRYALGIPDEVKVSNCSLASDKKYPNIYRIRSDLCIDSVKKSGKFYKVSFSNMGFFADSKPCTLVIKCGNKILKKVYVKSLVGVIEGSEPQKTIKVAIPTKYANKKYTKIAIIDYYNVNKEYIRKDNQYKFKF